MLCGGLGGEIWVGLFGGFEINKKVLQINQNQTIILIVICRRLARHNALTHLALKTRNVLNRNSVKSCKFLSHKAKWLESDL